MDAGEADRADEVEGSPPGGVVLGREADDDVAVDRDARDRGSDAIDDRRVLGRDVAAAHPAEHAVVARLERQVDVGHRARRAVDPGPEQLVVDVLGLDRREAQPLDRGLVEDPPDEAGQRQRGARVGAAEAALGPAAVVRPDVDPGQDDLAMTRAERAPDVLQHGLRGEAPLRAAGGRDDAVGAEERAAVLDLHEGPGPLDRRPLVGDALDLDARQRGERPRDARVTAPCRTDQPLDLLEQRVLRAVVDQPRVRIRGRERVPPDLHGAARDDDLRVRVRAAGAPDGLARLLVGRRGHRAGVDEDQVRAGGRVAVDDPDAALAEHPRRRLHLGLVDLAAEVRDRGGPDGAVGGRGERHHSWGFVLIRNPIVPTSAAIA